MILEFLCLIPPLSQVIAVLWCAYLLRIMWKTHFEMVQLRNELLKLQGKLGSLAMRHSLYLDKVESVTVHSKKDKE